MPGFWEARIEPEQLPSFQAAPVDVAAATAAALERRLDLQQARSSLEADDINIRFFRNQTLPDLTATVDYGLTGLGGTQFIRGPDSRPGRRPDRARPRLGARGSLLGTSSPTGRWG
jgi:outer membrane protein TolC